MMRVEEMYLIEAEAAGMQDESRGIALLTTFAKSRDTSYTCLLYTSTNKRIKDMRMHPVYLCIQGQRLPVRREVLVEPFREFILKSILI